MGKLGFLLRDQETRAGRLTNATLYVLNTAFIALYIASTYPVSDQYATAIRGGELLLGGVFLGEYVVRVYSAEDRRAEVTSIYTIADLIAVLPVFVLPGPDVGFLRGLHTLRVFRFMRLIGKEQQVFGQSVRLRSVRRAELSMTIFLIFFISTGFVYAAEHGLNPGINDFGDAFYYTVIAVSTVGFGDIIPQTVLGRWVTITAVLLGFVLLPWQASRLRDIPAEPDDQCERCGEAIATEDRYCRQCGESLVEVQK